MPENDPPLDQSFADSSSEAITAADDQNTEQQITPLIIKKQAQAERKEFEDKYLRAVAELDTVRRRLQRERDEERRYAALPVVKELLPVIDNLTRAVDAAAQGGSVDDLKQGVAMVLQQATEVLGQFQVQPIEAINQPFDPNLHEALTQIPSADHPPMTIVQEVETGYKLHDRVIRPSKVIVSSAPA